MSTIMDEMFGDNTSVRSGVGLESVEGMGADVMYAEIQQMDAAEESCLNAISGLESLQVDVEEALKRGGAQPDVMRQMDKSMTYIVKPLYDRTNQVGLASFDGVDGRLIGTEAFLEDVKNTIVKIWKAIVKFIREWTQKIKNFWGEHAGKAKRVREAAKKLVEKADESNGVTDKDKVDISTNVWKNLSVGGTLTEGTNIKGELNKFDTALTKDKLGETTIDQIKGFVKIFEDVKLDVMDSKTGNEGLGNMFDGMSKTAKEYAAKIKDKITKTTSSGEGAKLKEEYMIKDLAANYTVVRADNKKEFGISDKETGFVSKVGYMGNKIILYKHSTLEVGGLNLVAKQSINVRNFQKKEVKGQSSPKAAAMAPSDISTVAGSVAELAETIRKDNEGMLDRMNAIRDYEEEIKNKVEELNDMNGELTTSDEFKALKKWINAGSSWAKTAVQPTLGLSEQGLRSAIAALDYSERCYSNLKEDS